MNERTPQQIIAEYHANLASMGGKARAAALGPERRSAIARKAAKASAKVRKANARNKKKES